MVRKFDRISIEFSIEFFGRKFYRIFLAGKFHCGIVFEGEETFVTPLATTVAVVATLWPPAVSVNVTGIFFTEKKPCDTLVCGF